MAWGLDILDALEALNGRRKARGEVELRGGVGIGIPVSVRGKSALIETFVPSR